MASLDCRLGVYDRWHAVALCLGLLTLIVVAEPAKAGVCDKVPFCQVQRQHTFYMHPWGSSGRKYTCDSKSGYPYVWNAVSDHKGVSLISEISGDFPGTINVLMTNWDPFHGVHVTPEIACSKSNSFGGDCGPAVRDPKCPVVPGSDQNYCSKGPVPVCIQTYQERCEDNNQLYQCTIDVVPTWPFRYCQACPG